MSSSRVRRTSFIGIALAALLTLGAAPAWAHDSLIGVDPADGATVDALPAQIELTFSGVLIDDGTEMVVTDTAGTDLTDGAPVVDGVHVTQALTGSATGTVCVAWRVVSSDGHPVSDTFAFGVGADAPVPTACTGAAAAPDGGTDATDGATEVDLTGWLWGGAAVVVAGILLLVVLTRKRGPRED